MSANSPAKILNKYLPEKKMVRLLVIMIVILALAAGYYKSLYEHGVQKYLRLEESCARVRE